ncbi:phosphonate C-P lyase system protein PhnG [Zafaria sp. J156]|uniref:phosphonate C-P lyase system protein PhnG n=1 Tax=Micrococcales TaxID=85006 RepID=UPI00210ACA7C|nr:MULTISPECIES: phosphonate C-P lyase system protein PhnG [Micrococcales]MEE2524405.1 phosphonate C-P lyase system protein PhnG [Pseudarthrobacter sp. J47]MEE2570992.1 phosphonate C-P lyase system protein PhnG [Pseudarthrobacter sp. J64]
MTSPTDHVAERQRWMRVLALASTSQLSDAWAAQPITPKVDTVRGPEAGLVMVRGRAGAGGDRFNLGEATVVRATLRVHGAPLEHERVGTSYALGTDVDHAWFAAAFDGLLQDAGQRERVLADVITPLAQAQRREDDARAADARSTKVDFFTVAREHA